MKELPLMLDDTIQAFECCIKTSPDCDNCPLMNDLCFKYVKNGKLKMINSVLYYLRKVNDYMYD